MFKLPPKNATRLSIFDRPEPLFGISKLNPGLQAFMKKKMKKKM